MRRRRGDHRELNLVTEEPSEIANPHWNTRIPELAPGRDDPVPENGASLRPAKGWAVKPLSRREIDPVVDEPAGSAPHREPEAPPSSPTATSTAHSADVERLMRLVVARLGISPRPLGNGTRPPSYLTELRSQPNAASNPI